MKKLMGTIFLTAVAIATVLATPQGNAEAWWTDFGPNGVVHSDGEPDVTALWWTDHGPNH